LIFLKKNEKNLKIPLNSAKIGFAGPFKSNKLITTDKTACPPVETEKPNKSLTECLYSGFLG